jgi:hypothetical protein
MNENMLRQQVAPNTPITAIQKPGDEVVEAICALNWRDLSLDQMIDVAWAYYYFSVQFRENLAAARELLPDDEQLEELDRGERDTYNLSPYPGVGKPSQL